MTNKLPSFQFYPGDWMKDPALRRCSHAAKGIWMDLLCLMFECDERGVLASNGQAWTDAEIARAVGGDFTEVSNAIQELLRTGAARRNDDGAIFCARMVRDEEVRKIRAESGKKGGNPVLLNQNSTKGISKIEPNPENEDKRFPTPSSSSSSSEENTSSLRSDAARLSAPREGVLPFTLSDTEAAETPVIEIPPPVETAVKDAPKAKPEKSKDPLLEHPAIIAYREVIRLHVPVDVRPDVAAEVGDEPSDVDLWRKTVHDWLARGRNKQNVAGMLDAFKQARAGNVSQIAHHPNYNHAQDILPTPVSRQVNGVERRGYEGGSLGVGTRHGERRRCQSRWFLWDETCGFWKQEAA